MQTAMFNQDGTPTREALPADPSAECSAEALAKVDVDTLERLTEQEYKLSPNGAIADEIVTRLQMMGKTVDYLSIRPRVSKLKADGTLVTTGTRRLNVKGNTCAVLLHRHFKAEAL